MILKYLLAILLANMFPDTSSTHKATIITGNLANMKGEVLYLKNNDPFCYAQDAYILDSCIVNEVGDFRFELIIDAPQIFQIADSDGLPPSYDLLREAPDLYHYSFCAKTYAVYPTLYVQPTKHYEVKNWAIENRGLSIQYSDRENALFVQHYRNHSFLDLISDKKEGAPLQMTPEAAWNIIEASRNELFQIYGIDANPDVNSFDHYMQTEVELGAINDFLLWYGTQPYFETDEKFYIAYMKKYNSQDWHPLSMEYFKFNERFIAFNMNDKKMGKLFFPSNTAKIQNAELYTPHNIRDKYLSNLRQLSK